MIEQLLVNISFAAFIEQHYFRFPFAHTGGSVPLRQLGTWLAVESILAEPNVDVMVVRQGSLIKIAGVPTFSEARAYHADGCTIVIRNSQRHHADLGRLASEFQQAFRAPVDIHIYCTPAGASGFGWHYDAEEVFILQTEGGKEYSLRKNTVHPWPLVETIPADMHYEREIMPLMRCTLAAGDWLYIPAGYWHKAQAIDASQESISLAIGVMASSAMDVFDFLRTRLVTSLLWRQRLAPLALPGAQNTASTAEEAMASYRRTFAELGEDLVRSICDERFLSDFLASRVNSTQTGTPLKQQPNH